MHFPRGALTLTSSNLTFLGNTAIRITEICNLHFTGYFNKPKVTESRKFKSVNGLLSTSQSTLHVTETEILNPIIMIDQYHFFHPKMGL